jgi:acetylornithine deacetylase/succinyl-diaminopimelate desuccinylase-like protein
LTDAVARHGERFVEEWREACRIASVAGSGSPELERMAAWVERRLEPLFDRVERLPVPGQPPVVLGELAGTGTGRLLVYSHYDVQPPGDESAWSSPPFAAELRDGAVYARGCCDDKADVTARLQALELWLAGLGGRPPYSIVWLSEGAEEIGSPGLADVLAAHAERLRADACLWESYVRRDDGRPEVTFGCRGLLSVRLRARALTGDQHAAFAPVFRSAAAELVRALATLTDEHGTVAVEGFHDDVVPLTDTQVAAARAVPPPGAGIGVAGASPYPPGLDDADLGLRLNSMPTANISGLAAGDPASNLSIVPAAAAAKVDFSLVPEQEPDDIAAKLRAHLDRHGFGEIAIEVGHTLRPARGSLETPLARAAVAAAADVYGDPVVYPLLPGAGPGRLFLDLLGATIVSPSGTMRLASGIHAPDEHGAVDDYLDHVRFSLRLFERLADEPPR